MKKEKKLITILTKCVRVYINNSLHLARKYINNNLHLTRKYSRIFVRGHYQFREADRRVAQGKP